jgi:hypothetical protein
VVGVLPTCISGRGSIIYDGHRSLWNQKGSGYGARTGQDLASVLYLSLVTFPAKMVPITHCACSTGIGNRSLGKLCSV